MEFITNNFQETQKIAKDLAKELAGQKSSNAAVLGLKGDLGAGKTTFVQGLAASLGIKERVLSPTFVIMKRFKINDLRFKNLYHVDAYRIERAQEMEVLGFPDIFKNPENLIVIEWAEKIKDILPKDTIWLEFEHLGEDQRKIKVQNVNIKMTV